MCFFCQDNGLVELTLRSSIKEAKYPQKIMIKTNSGKIINYLWTKRKQVPGKQCYLPKLRSLKTFNKYLS